MDEKSILNKIIEFETLDNTEIDVSFLHQQSRKSTKLINNVSEENFQKGQSRKFSFKFREPVFVGEIRIYTSGYSNGTAVELGTKNIFGTYSSFTSNVQNGETTFLVGKFLTSFHFKPARSINTGKKIEKVVIEGLTEDEFAYASLDFSRLHKLKEKIITECQLKISEAERKQESLDEIKNEISELGQKKSAMDQDIEDLEESYNETNNELEGLKSTIETKKSEISELNKRIDNATDSLNVTSNEKNQLNKQISEKQNQLKLLVDDINLFPTEIKAFVSQGAQSIKRYTLLATIPILAIGAITLALFFRAADLSSVITNNPDTNIWGVFLTRLPYVAVCASILAASYKISKIFISEIIKINEQRLNLSKISIIAKDVQHASTEGLDLSDEAKAKLNTKLKMEMLRDHLKLYLTDEFYSSRAEIEKRNASKNPPESVKDGTLDSDNGENSDLDSDDPK